ncbi:FKBP-type peptidyl-prolyl cis-trans isomerase [Marinibactrum halimedae]|uniref:Peptidyl-prolyl cis-trans isomerase n=1 Tax=Marinibactrum halimedae TaxID=1444977 RepID=A0AA37T6S3_9GAMM|nr:peptidylprolyl isomerase [Marinibactrum halimedae]MCD9457615.1 peptidylprolyl isomerase [Marinibactrum halimedae]GLS28035.1 peptidyl-prolyl cis-trans isomerase [Marinibactrum halimedae]
MSDLTIGPGTRVTLHFALKLEDGEVVDSTFGGEPATFDVGDGNLLEGFERALFGMAPGTKETLVIKPENGFGQRNPENIQEIPREEFDPGIEMEEGLVLSFADAQNAELPGVVSSFDEEFVFVDFNHPLSGRDIHFEVEIIDIAPVTTH